MNSLFSREGVYCVWLVVNFFLVPITILILIRSINKVDL
jgi:hypothetical protein